MTEKDKYKFRKLPKHPLSLVLAEFRFSPVLKMERYVPDIQDALRKDYPVFDKGLFQTVEFVPGQISVTEMTRWLFFSSDRHHAVILSQDRLVFMTAQYERFPVFKKCCGQALSALLSSAEPALIHRIGLRYNDHIRVTRPNKFKECVDPALLPDSALFRLGNGIRHHRVDSAQKTQEGTLLIRSLFGFHKFRVMPDLHQDLPLTLTSYTANEEEPSLILDFDHYWESEAGESFGATDSLKRLTVLHELAREAFWDATTDFARETLWT